MLKTSPRGVVVDVWGSEDQIYALIEKAIATSNPGKLEDVMAELRVALKDHIQQTRTSAASMAVYTKKRLRRSGRTVVLFVLRAPISFLPTATHSALR
jgi:hypothetical protein